MGDEMQEMWKTVVSFFQVNGSFLTTFQGIQWPQAFSDIAGFFSGIFAADWINPALLGETVSSMNYCNSAHCGHLNSIFLRPEGISVLITSSATLFPPSVKRLRDLLYAAACCGRPPPPPHPARSDP
eukprot:158896-Prymnesium_polylepis.1